jgi:predicted ester cyclase
MGRVMSAEQNKAVLRRYFDELWNKGNLAVIDECVAAGMSLNKEKNVSLDKWRQALTAWLTALPDFEYHVEPLIAEGDIVAAKTHFTGTHQGVYDFGEWGPWPPTGNSVNIKEFIFFRLAGGKIVEMWDSWDDQTFAHQLSGQPPVAAGRT